MPAPYEVLIGALCERLSKLPEEVENSDLPRLMRMMDQLDIYRTSVRFHAQGTTEGMSDYEDAMIGRFLTIENEMLKKEQEKKK